MNLEKPPKIRKNIHSETLALTETELNADGSKVEVKESLSIEWRPKKDITLYELACLLPHLMGVPLFEEGLKKMGKMARHFKRVKEPK